MENIKISIIIPMYNVENYIAKCVQSILAQKNSNYEIIVVDDGSKDNSNKIVKSFNSPLIKIIEKENGGLSSARNEGVKYATGDYIWFVDGDDYLEDNALECVYEVLKSQKLNVVSCNYYKDYGDKKFLMEDDIDWNDMKQMPLINTSACTKIIKTSFYREFNFRFPEGKIYEDLAIMPYIMAKAGKIGLIKEPLYNYVYRPNSIMTQRDFKENRDDKFFAIDNLYKEFSKGDILNMYKSELEYLTIKHLLIVYSTEILPYGKDIYYKRCERALEYLEAINSKWFENVYLKKTSALTKVYVWLFRKKMFYLCKIALKIKGI